MNPARRAAFDAAWYVSHLHMNPCVRTMLRIGGVAKANEARSRKGRPHRILAKMRNDDSAHDYALEAAYGAITFAFDGNARMYAERKAELARNSAERGAQEGA